MEIRGREIHSRMSEPGDAGRQREKTSPTSQTDPPARGTRSQRPLPTSDNGRTESEQLADVVSQAQQHGVESTASATKNTSPSVSRSGSRCSARPEAANPPAGPSAQTQRAGTLASPTGPREPQRAAHNPRGASIHHTSREVIGNICQDTYARLQTEQQAAIGRLAETVAQLQKFVEAIQANKIREREREQLIGNAVKMELQYPPAGVSSPPPYVGVLILDPLITFPPHRKSRSRRRAREGHRRNRQGKRDTSSEDESDSASGTDSTDPERSIQSTRGGVFSRPKGPKVRGLVELQPTN